MPYLLGVQIKDAPATAHHIVDTAGVRHRGGGDGEGGVHPVLVGHHPAARELESVEHEVCAYKDSSLKVGKKYMRLFS